MYLSVYWCVTCVSVGAVQTGKLNVVLPGIGPVYTVIDEVQGKSIGPCDLILYDDTSVGAVHPDSPDVRVVAPVRPIQVPNQQGIKIVLHLHCESWWNVLYIPNIAQVFW